MTFKGVTYETLIEFEILLITQKAILKAYELELKFRRLQREKEEVDAVYTKINLQTKFIKELEEIKEELVENMDILTSNLNDIEGQVFLSKFVLDKKNDEIIKDLAICQTRLYEHYDNIKKQLETTSYGKKIENILKK